MFNKFYKCNFCKIDCEILPFSILRLTDKLIGLIGMRLYQCPHCFSCTRLPWVPHSLRQSSASGDAKASKGDDLAADCGPVLMVPDAQKVIERVRETV